jgi:hypothetical protein
MKPTRNTRILIRRAVVFCLAVFVFGVADTQSQSSTPRLKGNWHSTPWGQSFQPEAGVVTDEKTAIQIAEAILLPIYGEKTISMQRPLTASLKAGVWTVQGTLPEGWDGGTATVRLSKKDGRVLFICHYK